MKTRIFTIVIVMLSVVCSANATLWYEEGNYTFTDTDPQNEEVFVGNNATLDFLSGTASGLRVGSMAPAIATANLYGGAITYDLYTSGNSVTNIYLIDLYLLVSDQDSIVNIYAYDVAFFSVGGINNDPYMTGTFYQDDTNFSTVIP